MGGHINPEENGHLNDAEVSFLRTSSPPRKFFHVRVSVRIPGVYTFLNVGRTHLL